MRTILVISLIICFAWSAKSTTYYISLGGNDGDGKSLTNAWKSIAKLNANWSIILPGDTIKLRSGDTFLGTIAPTKSGTSTAPIVITTTASGKATITALTTLSSFTQSGNIYSAILPSAESEANFILMDGKVLAVGRWPNDTTATPYGYIKYTAEDDRSISDASWTSHTKPNGNQNSWVGATVSVRENHFRFRRFQLYSGKQTFSGTSTTFRMPDYEKENLNGVVGYGYFLQNHLAFLDKNTEWCYDSATRKVSIYLSGGTSGHTFQAPIINTLIDLTSRSYFKINNLNLTGANGTAININGTNGNDVTNCGIYFSGDAGIRYRNSDNFKVTNNDIDMSLTFGINVKDSFCSHYEISRNTINHTMPIAGMNFNLNGQGTGIDSKGSNVVIQYNKVSNSAYSGIDVNDGSNVQVQYNRIDSANKYLDDGGAFYTVNQILDSGYVNKIAKQNIITNTSTGFPYRGTMITGGQLTMSMYGDLWTTNWTFDNNTLIGERVAVYVNNPFNNKIINNTLYEYTTAGVNFMEASWVGHTRYIQGTTKVVTVPPIYGNTVTGNVMFSSATSTTKPAAAEYFSPRSDSPFIKHPTGWASIDKNQVVYPLLSGGKWFREQDIQQALRLVKTTRTRSDGTTYVQVDTIKVLKYFDSARTLVEWQKYNYDKTSTISPKFFTSTTAPVPLSTIKYNPTEVTTDYSLDGFTWVDTKGNPYNSNVITLLPYTSKVLIKTGTFTGNTAPTVTITAPSQGQTFTAPATIDISADAKDDGAIKKVDFYNGSILLFSDTTYPYSYRWSGVATNSYSISAKATDNLGLTGSASVNIQVNPSVGPTVSITSPANNSQFTVGGTANITANAFDDGTVTKVDFYNGTTLLFSDATAPYAYDWTNLAIGNYTLTAKATDNSGLTTTSGAVAISVVAGNNPPSVSITSPLNGAKYTAPASVTITANASDIDGSISKVEFYNGSTLLSTVTSSPYTYNWTSVASGSYNITAKAYDNLNIATTSPSINISVGAAVYPKVFLTSPINNTSYTSPATITITATATDSLGTIASVKFYNGTTLIHTETTAPYTWDWVGVANGTYTITAVATSNNNLSTTSGAVTVTVKSPPVNLPPTVSITSPSSGAQFTAPATISLSATAADADGTVSSVSFYNGSTLLGTDNSSPYTFSWTSVAANNYNITAKATDNLGAVTTSASIAVSVTNPVYYPVVTLTSPINNTTYLPTDSITLSANASETNGKILNVKFYSGSSTVLRTETTAPYFWKIVLPVGNYNITAVATDTAGRSTTSGIANITVVLPNKKPVVTITSPLTNSTYTTPLNLPITVAASDSDGTVKKVSFYSGGSFLGSTTVSPFTYSYNSIPAGQYSFSAIATDDKGDSTVSSVVFVTVKDPNKAPLVAITAPTQNQQFLAPAGININATASDADGLVDSVSFYNGSQLLYTDTSEPYSFLWSGVPVGSYTLKAVAIDNNGLKTTSALVSISVRSLVGPAVSITAPANNSTYLAPANFTLSATASDPDGTVKRVQFYRGATLVGTDSISPYTFAIASLAAGTYQFTARATDNDNLTTTSSAITVVVTAPKNPPTVSMSLPANNSTFGDTLAVALRANAADVDGTVTRVDFYAGSTLIATSYTSPYNAAWNNPVAGTYLVTAKAIDNDGLVTTSAPITVTITHKNILPTVAIISPNSGATFNKKEVITFSAVADDMDGRITKVEFYVNGALVGTSTGPSYTTTHAMNAAGDYVVTAKAYDNSGAVVTSSPITVIIGKQVQVSGAQILIK